MNIFLYFKKPFNIIFILIVIFIIIASFYGITKAQKETSPEFLNSFAVKLLFQNQELMFDPDFPSPIFESIESPRKIISGAYLIKIYSTNDKLLFKASVNPNQEKNLVYLPYFLNAGTIKIINPNKKVYEESFGEINVCNENNVCESREKNFCPLDCESANNLNYPFSPNEKISKGDFQKIQPQPLENPIATITPESSKNQLKNYLITLGAGIIFLLIVFAIMQLKRK